MAIGINSDWDIEYTPRKEYNVLDQLKELSVPEVKEYCQRNTIPAAVAMMHVNGDFNFSQIVRTANFFGFDSVHYWGKKKWDRRGAVGTQNYTPIHHYPDHWKLSDEINKGNYLPIAIENNHHYPVTQFQDVDWWKIAGGDKDGRWPMFIFGEESAGLDDETLEMVIANFGYIIEIPQEGSVRSLNVASTFAIIAATYNLFARHS